MNVQNDSVSANQVVNHSMSASVKMFSLSIDLADVIVLVWQKDAKSTKNSTKTAVKTFKEFLVQHNMDTNIAAVLQEWLNNGM